MEMKNYDLMWKCELSKPVFALKSFRSLIFRSLYFFFSLYWIWRYFYIKASPPFLALGLFFLITSFFILFSPILLYGRVSYNLESDNFVVRGCFGKKKLFGFNNIAGFEMKESFIDHRFNTMTVEFECVTADSHLGKSIDLIVIYGVVNHQELKIHLTNLLQKNKSEL